MKGVWRKTIGGLKPADALAEEVYQGLALNAEVFAEVTRPRNLGHHKKLFALMKIIRDNFDEYGSVEDVLDTIKIATGHSYQRKLPNGQWVVRTKSIAFNKLDQLAFNDFWDRACRFVLTDILKGTTREDLEAEIFTMVS